jgi:hypothetical protein
MVCPKCSADQMPGTMFCSECGSYLATSLGLYHLTPGAEKPTVERPSPTSAEISRSAAGIPAGAPAEAGQPWRQVMFVFLPHGRRITLEMQSEIRIGRADPESEIKPELDLTNFGGEELGVSRLHAIVHTTDKGVMLVDLDSTNGTLLNREQMEPHRAYRLQNGDIIQFGRLQVQLYLS